MSDHESQLIADMDHVTHAVADFIAVVASFSELSAVAFASRVNRTWCEAMRSDRLWRALLERQWIGLEGALGSDFVGGWHEVCRCFCTIKAGVWRPAPKPEQQRMLESMSELAEHFLFGVVHGFVPGWDGLFSYHCSGATPIHYRYDASATSGNPEAQGRPSYMEHGESLCTGGRWEWSPDRTTWFPTSTYQITRGRFGTGGWHLVTDNRAIVAFLEQWPLVPRFMKSIDLHRPAAVMRHTVLNERCLTDFMHVMHLGVPSTSCVFADAFTVHFFFVPPLYLACGERGWQLAELMRSQTSSKKSVEEFHNVLAALNRVRDKKSLIHLYDRQVRRNILGLD